MQWPINDGKSVLQTVEELQKSVEKNGAKKSGLFSVEAESYGSNYDVNKVLQTLSSSEYPASCFAWFEEGSSVVCDNVLPSFLLKLGEHWQTKKGGKMECKGHRFIISDFLLKIGIVTQSSSSKGVAIEVEYIPCQYFEECAAFMTEFINTMFDGNAPSPPQNIPTLPANSAYTPQHTARQYVALFNIYSKTANVR